MYIVMNEDKSLAVRERVTIYQTENLVDKIQILLPQNYKDLSIADSTVQLEYIDVANIPHAEVLKLCDEMYRDRLQYVLPVDSRLTQFAGDIPVHISIGGQNSELLHTGDVTITVEPFDWYKFNKPVCDDVVEFGDPGSNTETTDDIDVVEF